MNQPRPNPHALSAPESAPALFFPRFALAAALALGLAAALAGALAGCARIEPVRTLPHWVRGVYIPMVRNSSYEPGIEETATQLIQEEFLADGRLRVVPKDKADVMVEVRIQNYRTRVENSRNDHIASSQDILILSEIQIRDPDDKSGSDTPPIAKIGPIQTRYTYDSDTRSTNVEIEPDARRSALTQLARQVVDQTITGFPAQLMDQAPGTVLPEAPGSPYGAGGHGGGQRERGGNFGR